jgi:hypothetical protein
LHRRTRSALRAAAAGLGLVMAGLSLTAVPATAGPAKPEGHCVVALADGNATTCFGTFTEAISFATAGRVTDAPAAAAVGDSLKAKIDESNRVASTSPTPQAVTLSIEYEGAPPPGAWSLTFTGDVQCTASFADVNYTFVLPQAYWDQISSYATFYCYVDHHYLTNLAAPSTGFYFCSPAGAWCTIPLMQPGNINGDNNTRSLRWT